MRFLTCDDSRSTYLSATSIALLFCACGDMSEYSDGSHFTHESETEISSANVELKFVVDSSSIDSTLSQFGLHSHNATHADVYFFDTNNLDLYSNGVIVRARIVENGTDDSTIKMRPLQTDQVAAAWFEVDGFKCEGDRNGALTVNSCSLTSPENKKDLRKAISGKESVTKILDKHQEQFAETYAAVPLQWQTLRALGPIDSQSWKVHANDGWNLAIEMWTLPDDTQFLEISMRVAEAHNDALYAALLEYMATNNITANATGQSKTSIALSYFANHLSPY